MYLHSFYKVFARYYDDFHHWFANWKGIREAESALDQALAAHIRPGARILDLGCGTGQNIDRLLRLDLPFEAYLGVDQSDHMMATAARKHEGRSDVTFQRMRLDLDELPAGPFDVIVSSWVFSHLANPERLVDKAVRRLKPGGVLLATFKSERHKLVDALLYPFYKAYDALPVRRSSLASFPHVVRLERHWGGWATFVVCQAPVDTPGAGATDKTQREPSIAGQPSLVTEI